jgi:hypothetical protein
MDTLIDVEQALAIGFLLDVALIVFWCRRKGKTFSTLSGEVFNAFNKLCAAMRNFISS